jgi:hypothetical protein
VIVWDSLQYSLHKGLFPGSRVGGRREYFIRSFRNWCRHNVGDVRVSPILVLLNIYKLYDVFYFISDIL